MCLAISMMVMAHGKRTPKAQLSIPIKTATRENDRR